jgi:hypothetical protein
VQVASPICHILQCISALMEILEQRTLLKTEKRGCTDVIFCGWAHLNQCIRIEAAIS